MNRRKLLTTSGLVLSAAMVSRHAAAMNAADPSKLLQTYTRIRGGAEAGLGLWWYTGTVWGKQTDEMARPFFLVQGLTYNRVTIRPDGGIEQKLTGRGWYADIETGKPLETWTNPLTGEKLTPPHIKSMQVQQINADGTMPVRDPDVMDTFDGEVGGLTVNGDTVWLTENFVAKYKPDAKRNGAVNTTSSLTTFTAKVKDVEDERVAFVPAYMNYQSMGAWPAWMKMGKVPGILSWQTRGQKVVNAEAGPADLRSWIETKYPGFLKTPGI
jgi:hypothetical protein